MARPPTRQPPYFALLVLLPCVFFVLGAGCFGDPPAPAQPPQRGERPENSKGMLLPLNERVSPLVGEKDSHNHYLQTVIVKTALSAETKRECSGVLIATRLVLTAGHCVCMERKTGTGGSRQALIDSTSCAKRATIATVQLAPQEGADGTEVYDKTIRHYQGEVRPHPELKIMLNAEGQAASVSADLAVIFLHKPVGDEFPSARLAKTEVQPNEQLFTAGYIHGGNGDGNFGTRLIGQGKVTRVPEPGKDRIEWEPAGAETFSGDSGGPGFLSVNGEMVLAGIGFKALGEKSAFTSIYVHRSWLEVELKHTEEAGAVSP